MRKCLAFNDDKFLKVLKVLIVPVTDLYPPKSMPCSVGVLVLGQKLWHKN
jgi:hypothetical protein